MMSKIKNIVSIVFPLPECHIVGIIPCVAFSNGLLSLSDVHLRFVNVFILLIAHFFLALNKIPLPGCLFILSPIEGRLGCFNFWQL